MTVLRTDKAERRRTRYKFAVKPFVIFLILFFIVWSLRATIFFSLDQRFESAFSKAVYSNTLKFILWTLPVFIYLKMFEGVRPFEYLKLTTRVNQRGLMYAVAASVIFFGGLVSLEHFASGKNLYLSNVPGMAILSSSVSSALEEIFFRGFVLNELWQKFGFRPANLIAAILFTLIHWPNWLWTSGFNLSMIATSLSILVLGVFLGYLMKWTNSLWPSIAAHIINNTLSVLLRV
jgi:membrane protease YdiL (CAAX protease family)